mmetsp:Transcript_6414/g.18480  ORF Transcript_6414/g.18480 Transcript_6414/m.18480 type:complete len:790 (+) Transcript_6414:39-2408(+)
MLPTPPTPVSRFASQVSRARSKEELHEGPRHYDCHSEDSFIAECVRFLVVCIQGRIDTDPYSKILIGLSGGSTPKKILTEFGRLEELEWSRLVFFLVDERYVPRDHPDSNQRMLQESLCKNGCTSLDAMVVPDTSLPLDQCIAKYHQDLSALISQHGTPDIVTLGMGEDGHIASWFPTLSPADYARATDPAQLVHHTQTDRFAGKDRITISLDLIARATHKVYFLSGENKMAKWREVLHGGLPQDLPALYTIEAGGVSAICYPPLSAVSQDDAKRAESEEHTTFVVLGASGDLAKKKTFPALFSLFCEGRLPRNFTIVGYARTELSFDDFWERLSPGLSKVGAFFCDKGTLSVRLRGMSHICLFPDKFRERCTYFCGQYGSPDDAARLDKLLQDKHEAKFARANRMYYLALPPTQFADAVRAFKPLAWSQKGWNRVIVEKPFGHDLPSSDKLASELMAVLEEKETYRIDHYLGKEMVLNLMALRFGNVAFTPIWSNHYVANVRITFKEDIGTEGRGGYFDKVGIIRDVMQNHLLQMLTLVAMERPASLLDEDIRDEKVKVLKQIAPIKTEHVVLGQYTRSEDGKTPGYKDDPGVPADSQCPTFATLVMFINNERWAGVPFIMKAGKALEERMAEVRIQLKDVPGGLFGELARNEFVIKVQPNEAVYMKIYGKQPGLSNEVEQTELDLSLHDRFDIDRLPDAYERLILDCVNGDKRNFVRTDELREAWRIFTPMLHTIDGLAGGDAMPVTIHTYPFGSRGPPDSDALVQHFGYKRTTGYTWKPKKKAGAE